MDRREREAEAQRQRERDQQQRDREQKKRGRITWQRLEEKRKIAIKQANETPPPCFVATAVFESSECEQVAVLRLWRDTYLRRHPPGRAFIKLY
jgi:hypothetical protein